jgi:hypothetical protein
VTTSSSERWRGTGLGTGVVLATRHPAGPPAVADGKSCEEPSDRRAALTRLAASARLGVYFYSLTVHDGAVHAVKERQIIPAC